MNNSLQTCDFCFLHFQNVSPVKQDKHKIGELRLTFKGCIPVSNIFDFLLLRPYPCRNTTLKVFNTYKFNAEKLEITDIQGNAYCQLVEKMT